MTGGVLVIDKPQGPTSHDVVDRVRRLLAVRRVGHAGTLDPMATGVLPLLILKATRLARFLSGGEKRYEARVRFGYATTTDDREGDALGPQTAPVLEAGALQEACRALLGDVLQVPPSYSAKRVGGRRLYELARSGTPAERGGARVTIHSLEVVRLSGSEADLEVSCSSGTYVRAIARDLGARLGCGGHLTALRRTRSGAFSLADARPMEALAGDPWGHVRPLHTLLTELPAVRVGDEGRLALLRGRDLTPGLVVSGFPQGDAPRLRVLDLEGELVGLAVPRDFVLPGGEEGRVLHPEIVLAEDAPRDRDG
jgi:tRNA pseudouridine55 synthase